MWPIERLVIWVSMATVGTRSQQFGSQEPLSAPYESLWAEKWSHCQYQKPDVNFPKEDGFLWLKLSPHVPRTARMCHESKPFLLLLFSPFPGQGYTPADSPEAGGGRQPNLAPPPLSCRCSHPRLRQRHFPQVPGRLMDHRLSEAASQPLGLLGPSGAQSVMSHQRRLRPPPHSQPPGICCCHS